MAVLLVKIVVGVTNLISVACLTGVTAMRFGFFVAFRVKNVLGGRRLSNLTSLVFLSYGHQLLNKLLLRQLLRVDKALEERVKDFDFILAALLKLAIEGAS